MLSNTTSSERTRVLVVDDNDATLTHVIGALTPDCFVVGAVKNGASALDAASMLRPDVIVLDISMPGMSGFEVAARLRKAGSTAALVFLSVHDDDEFIIAAGAAGAIGYVVKRRLVPDLLPAVRDARLGRRFVSTVR